jgi:glycosyltransferase involved in cell wall biosynthesis
MGTEEPNVLLSIVVPVRNARTTLPRMLGCIPDTSSIQLVIIDDGSTDGTASITSKWAWEKTRVDLKIQAHAGPGAARDLGLKLCLGTFVTFADADDEIRVEALMEAARQCERERLDVFSLGFSSTMPSGAEKRSRSPRFLRGPLSRTALLKYSTVWSRVYRREFLEVNGIGFGSQWPAEDVSFLTRLAEARPRVAWSESVAYVYASSADQLTKSEDYAPAAWMTIMTNAWDRSRDHDLDYRIFVACISYLHLRDTLGPSRSRNARRDIGRLCRIGGIRSTVRGMTWAGIWLAEKGGDRCLDLRQLDWGSLRSAAGFQTGRQRPGG